MEGNIQMEMKTINSTPELRFKRFNHLITSRLPFCLQEKCQQKTWTLCTELLSVLVDSADWLHIFKPNGTWNTKYCIVAETGRSLKWTCLQWHEVTWSQLQYMTEWMGELVHCFLDSRTKRVPVHCSGDVRWLHTTAALGLLQVSFFPPREIFFHLLSHCRCHL